MQISSRARLQPSSAPFSLAAAELLQSSSAAAELGSFSRARLQPSSAPCRSSAAAEPAVELGCSRARLLLVELGCSRARLPSVWLQPSSCSRARLQPSSACAAEVPACSRARLQPSSAPAAFIIASSATLAQNDISFWLKMRCRGVLLSSDEAFGIQAYNFIKAISLHNNIL